MADGTPARIKRIIDSFAGGGGASTGIKWAMGREVDAAINHDATAIAVHTANHPTALHFQEDVFLVDPRTVFPDDDIDLLWGSPDCTHFSKAKGGKPVSAKRRALAWVLVTWARRRRPRVIAGENVPEFVTWGPVGEDNKPVKEKAGLTFKRWIGNLKAAGYVIEWRELVAADYGAPTSRRRFFFIARSDGKPIVWPAPTHIDPKLLAKQAAEKQPSLFSSPTAPALKPWRTAAECIDWSIPCPSIFGRKKPLADKTLARIALGMKRYVFDAARPFIVPITHSGPPRAHSIDDPLKTVTTAHRGEFALAVPVLIQTGYGEREGQAPRVLDLGQPLGTIVAGGTKHALVAAFLAKFYGTSTAAPMTEPLPTVTSTGEHLAAIEIDMLPVEPDVLDAEADYTEDAEPIEDDADDLARDITPGAVAEHGRQLRAFMVKYFGNERGGVSMDEPMDTVTTKDRFGLVVVDGVDHVVVDIGLRMLTPRELARAQGFPEDYVFDVGGTSKTAQVRLIGNSVVPHLAKAIVAANQ